MKKFKSIHLIILLICIVFASCSNKTSPANFSCVPKDATFVSVLNIRNLAKKVKLENLQELEFYKKIENKKYGWLKGLSSNPASLGVNFNKDILFFGLNNSNYKDFVLSFSLKDSDKFKSFIEGQVKNNQKFVNNGDYSFLLHEKMAIAYKDELVVITNKDYKGVDIKEKIHYLMSIKEDNSIIKNTLFKKFYDKREDVSVWFSSMLLSKGRFGQISKAKSIFGYDLKGESMGLNLKFDNDNLHLNCTVLPSKKLTAMLKGKYFMTNSFNTKILKFLPKENAIVSTLSLDTEKYFNRFKEFEKFEKMNASFVKTTNHTIEDLFKSLKGSVALSFHNSKGTQKSKLYSFSAIFERKDENILKIIKASMKKSIVQKDGFYEGDKGVYIINDKDFCMVTTRLDAIKAFKEGGYKKNSLRDSKLKSKIKDNSFHTNFSFDIDKNPILKKQTMYNSRKKHVYRKWSNFAKDVDLYSNGKFSFDLVVNTKESKVNSLFGLLKVIDEIRNYKKPYLTKLKPVKAQ